MEQLYRKTRHKLYKRALANYKQLCLHTIRPSGLCNLMWNSYHVHYDIPTRNSMIRAWDVMEQCPELMKHVPAEYSNHTWECYWFPRTMYEIRIKILEEAIELTKLKD